MNGDFIASNNFLFAAMQWIHDTQRNMPGTHSIDKASSEIASQKSTQTKLTQPGQIWNLGDINVVKGDKSDDVAAVTR